MKSPKKGESGLVVVPPPDVRNEINMWRHVFKAYDNQTTPHITIIFPFVPETLWNESRRKVTKALENIHPFTVKLRELGHFIHEESVLWLKPENGNNLMRIHSKMQEIFGRHIRPSTLSFVPHLTLGFFASVEELLKARTTVQKEFKPLQFTVDRVIYAIFDDEGWHIRDHIQLQ
ncbi:MAG: 2'-5' RNA ligase family protein [candidate division WOR-3 bacterium]|nr:MAG: 2'-5' RNA ligase family protein [candidate division WOR-3 bacterium]